MSALARPKGPLPQRVYWIRRSLVLGVAVLLVVVLGKVLTGGSDGSSDPEATARLAGQQVTPGPPGEVAGPTPPQTKAERKAAKKAAKKAAAQAAATPTETPLPEPDGECSDDDIVIKPVVTKAHAGGRIEFDLEISTREALACTWSASRDSLVVNITSGSDDIWTTRHCGGGLNKPTPVIARKETPAVVQMHWSGRRSDAECSNLTKWALPGYYHVHAAAFTGEPTSAQFELGKAQPATITKTVKPKPKNSKKAKKKKRNRGGNGGRTGTQPTEEPIPSQPNGAVEPNG